MTARCSFYVLDRADPADSKGLYVRTSGGHGLILDEAPAVGDLISLSGDMADPADHENTVAVRGTWRVLARQWQPASYGSKVWQSGDRPTVPIMVQVMVERAEGLFDASHYAAVGPRRTKMPA